MSGSSTPSFVAMALMVLLAGTGTGAPAQEAPTQEIPTQEATAEADSLTAALPDTLPLVFPAHPDDPEWLMLLAPADSVLLQGGGVILNI